MKQTSIRQSKTTFIDGAYEAICKAILSHQLKPGDRLRSKELAEVLSISRTPVERALERLAGEGLVEFRPGSGPYVARPTPENVLELYDLRLMLELYGSAYAVGRPDKRFLAQLEERMVEFENESDRLTDSYDSYLAVWEADRALHLHLLSACVGTQVRDLYSLVSTRIMLAQFSSFGAFFRESAVNEHRAIYLAFARGDGGAVAAAVRDHIEAARSTFIARAKADGIEVSPNRPEAIGAAMAELARPARSATAGSAKEETAPAGT
jgi:DNA-binding GntR family transcriptional regulator